MASKPGVLIYFDIAAGVDRMSDDDAGKLFKAILRYAQHGEVSNLDGMAAFAFDIVRPQIDRSEANYESKSQKSRYAVYVRECRRHSEEPLPPDEWSKNIDTYRLLSDDNDPYLTYHNVTEHSITERNVAETKPISNRTDRKEAITNLYPSTSVEGGVGGDRDAEFERKREAQKALLLGLDR